MILIFKFFVSLSLEVFSFTLLSFLSLFYSSASGSGDNEFPSLPANAGSTSLSSGIGSGMYRTPIKVDLFYDTLCPHSWLAFELLHRYRHRWNLDLHLRPVVMMDVFEGKHGFECMCYKLYYV